MRADYNQWFTTNDNDNMPVKDVKSLFFLINDLDVENSDVVEVIEWVLEIMLIAPTMVINAGGTHLTISAYTAHIGDRGRCIGTKKFELCR